MSGRTLVLGIAVLFAAASDLHGQEAGNKAQELSQKAANPIADLVSLPLQFNNDMGLGPYDRSSSVLNVQPVVPLAGGKIVTRTIFPFVWLPDVTSESGSYSSGLSDITFTGFYVPGGSSLMWGLGPVLEFPTGGSMRGSEKWSAGISGVALSQSGDWTLGILANNVWSFAGDADRQDVNKGLAQLFIVRQLGNGWYVNSAPVITVNWKAAEDQKWKVPLGAGGGKLLFLGRLPVNLQTQVYYYVVKPDVGPDWQFRFQVQMLFPLPGG
jgi:hypothetical protein